MKVTSMVLAFCISWNVMAASGTVQELERHLDEYQYAITVEWDQKDGAVYEKETQKFLDSIAALQLSEQEIISLAEKKFQNQAAINNLKTKLSLMGTKSSSAEVATALREASSELYGQGASWNGDAELVLMYAGIAALVGYVIWFYATHECVAWTEKWECSTTQSGNTTNTSCGWVDVCTQYEKK